MKTCLPQAILMEKVVKEMEANFDQGLHRLNWTSLGISEYASKLTTAVQEFDDVVNEVEPSLGLDLLLTTKL